MWEDLFNSIILEALKKGEYIENAYQDEDGIVITSVYGKQYLVNVNIKSL